MMLIHTYEPAALSHGGESCFRAGDRGKDVSEGDYGSRPPVALLICLIGAPEHRQIDRTRLKRPVRFEDRLNRYSKII